MDRSQRPPTVLVVEDEAFIRLDMVDCLEEAGCEVLQAAHAGQAIEILEQHPLVRLIFTDVDMPGSMDGLQLATYVRNRWPPIKIIVTSGHVSVTEEQLPKGGRFFRKPYRRPEIAEAVRGMLD